MRLRMLMLLTHGELCVCDIMAVLEEPQSKVSRHLAYLKHSGLIQGRRVGTWMHYFIRNPLDSLRAAHIEFLKRELSGLEWARADFQKMLDVQALKLCENAAGNASPSSAKRVTKKKRPRNRQKP